MDKFHNPDLVVSTPLYMSYIGLISNLHICIMGELTLVSDAKVIWDKNKPLLHDHHFETPSLTPQLARHAQTLENTMISTL